MSTLNSRQRASLGVAQTTHNGAPATRLDLVQQLSRATMATLLWEDTFYENGVAIADRMKELVAKNLPDDVAIVAHKAKHDMHLRHAPLLLARELFRNPKSRMLAGTLLRNLVTRPDDMTEFLAMYWKDNKDEPLAKQVKVALGDAFKKFDEYQLQKYKKEGHAISLRDVLRIVHPTPIDREQSKLWKGLVDETIGTAETWESLLSAGADKKATFEMLIREGKLGGLALLRNLRNMRQAGMDLGEIKQAILNVDTKKLWPTQLIAAYRHNPEFAKELDVLFLKLFANREKVKGSTAVLVDISGSMEAPLSGKSELNRIDASAGLAAIAQEMFEDVDIYAFQSDCVQVPAIRGFGLIEKICSLPRGGTNIGHAVKYAFNKRKYDRILVITDEQSSDRVDLPQGSRGYMMNVASYQNGVGYGPWIRIDGFSAGILNYMVEFEKTGIL